MTFGLAETPESPAVDLSKLNLRVVEARTVDSIKLNETDLKPQKGAKQVVVTLRGTLSEPGRVTVSAAAFSALYSEPVERPGGGPAEKVGKAQAQAIDVGGDGSWASTTTTTYSKAKDVLVDVTLPVPASISEFHLIWDTAQGKQRARVRLGAKK